MGPPNSPHILVKTISENIMEIRNAACASTMSNLQPRLRPGLSGREAIAERVDAKHLLHDQLSPSELLNTTALSRWQPPEKFLCPLVKTIMMLPMTSLETGISFEYFAILQWCNKHGNICPVTGGALGTLIRNHGLQLQIGEWQHRRQQFKAVRKASRRRNRLLDIPSSVEANKKPSQVPLKSEEDDKLIDCVRAHTKLYVQQHARKHEEQPRKNGSNESMTKSHPGRSIRMQSFFPMQSNMKQT